MENLITTFHPTHLLQEYGPGSAHYMGRKCVICEDWNSTRPNYMYCSACDLCFHKECSTRLMKNLTIDRQETHEHTLTFIRQKNFLCCVACGRVFSNMKTHLYGMYEINMYGCLPCNFFIHRDCIYLPKVIKLTRHSHRLFRTFQVPNYNTKCRLCHEPFRCGSGGYICTDKTCHYKLHSYCATREDTWDGRDLEGEPEETSNYEDVTLSLTDVDGKTFCHFSHHHDLMRLCVNGKKKEEGDERVCQACVLPVDFDSFLGCKVCDFALHDTCASLPRRLEHTFHRHPLTLEVNMMNIEEGFFSCSQCGRESCGFMYRCCQEECDFKMDAKCASLTDPFYSEAHRHHFYLVHWGAICKECTFSLSSELATLPVLVNCKYDIHPLTLCFVHPRSRPLLPFRCEICEITIESDSDYLYQEIYGCFDCNTVVHVECAIGKYPFLKPGHTIKLNGFEIEITSNNSLSRPVCHACHSICEDKLVFKDKTCSAISFCSIDCV